MTRTTFYPSSRLRQKMATLYQPDAAGKLTPTQPVYTASDRQVGPNPSAGLISCAQDLMRFYQCILDGGRYRHGRLLSESAVKQITSVQTGDMKTGFVPGSGWGLGWSIVTQPQGVTKMLSKGTFGHGGAYGTQGWVDPKTQTIYVLMIQRTKMGNSDASEVRKAFQGAAVDELFGE